MTGNWLIPAEPTYNALSRVRGPCKKIGNTKHINSPAVNKGKRRNSQCTPYILMHICQAHTYMMHDGI